MLGRWFSGAAGLPPKTPVSSMRGFWGLMRAYWLSENWKEAWVLTIVIALLTALLAPDPVPGTAWILLAMLTLSGLATIIAMGRSGVRLFWMPNVTPPRVRLIEMAPVALLLGLCLALTVAAGPVLGYLQETAQALHVPRDYIESVLPR